MSVEALWSVTFGTMLGEGAGVVVFETGRLFGGDTSFYYVGDYAVSGNDVGGNITVRRHADGLASVFGPLENFDLKIGGTYDGGDNMTLSGVVAEQPQMGITIVLRRIAELPG